VSWIRFLRRRRRAPSTPTPAPNTDRALYARARPELILVEERYSYDEEISRNSRIARGDDPAGKIVISVPYDGYECFSRDALRDVDRVFSEPPGSEHDAKIGYLVFVDHEETNLSEVLGLDGQFGAFPLRVPVRSIDLHAAETLIDDRSEYRLEVTYAPKRNRPELTPVRVAVDLIDPDHGDFSTQDRELYNLRDEAVQAVANAVTKFAGFKPILMARIRAYVTLPPRPGKDDARPVVRHVRVRFPKQACVPASSVSVHGTAIDGLQVDVRAGTVDWPGAAMQRHGKIGENSRRRFRSAEMTLRFEQPGELFEQRELDVEVDVEVPGELLSWTQVRLFNACGYQDGRARSTLVARSMITARCKVILRDSFAERYVSPFQSFIFDEIVPDQMRISDLVAALNDRRFEVREEKLPGHDNKKRIRYLLLARRIDGPATVELAIRLDGHRHPTRRESRHHVGHRYTSTFESGSLHLYVRGQVRGETRNLVQEVMALQNTLRERFRMLKAHR
jgi:hypothetical protein